MGKKETELEEMEAVEIKQPEYTHTALGTYKGPDNQWYVAVLKFDPETGLSKITDRHLAGEDRYFASEAFKIKAVELDLI